VGSPPVRDAAAVIAELLSRAPAAATTRFLEAVQGSDGQPPLNESTWGRQPDRESAAAAVLANVQLQFRSRREVEQVSLTRSQVADLLGTSDQAVTDLLAARRLFGLKQGRRWLIPAWQLDAGTERGVLPGLDQVEAHFPGGLVALSRWATTASPDLNGRTPAQALSGGAVDHVVLVAQSLTAAGW
jgi:excisionase family DNA binding protein